MIILLDGIAAILDRHVPPGMKRALLILGCRWHSRCRCGAAAEPVERGDHLYGPLLHLRATGRRPGLGGPSGRQAGRGAPQDQDTGIGPSLHRRRRARGGLLPAHGLHAARARRRCSRAAAPRPPERARDQARSIAYVASLGRGPPIPHPHPERGSLARGPASSSPSTAPAATRSSAEGGYVTGAHRRRRSRTRRRRRSPRRCGSART